MLLVLTYVSNETPPMSKKRNCFIVKPKNIIIFMGESSKFQKQKC